MTQTDFQPNCLPLLIGSLPLGDHEAAANLVFESTPEIPLWVQLPVYPEEGMIRQFAPGMPGLSIDGDKVRVDTADPDFEAALLKFYEIYMEVEEGRTRLDNTSFALTPETARGFFVFMDHLKRRRTPPVAVKGQVTGPITFCTALKTVGGQAIFYDEQLRDAAVKLLALKARWQVQSLAQFGRPVIIFIDEPALAGFGSSELISISREDVAACLSEVIGAVHAEGGLAGIHICANADWSVILESEVDIVNFDAYSYFDKFILYDHALRAYLDSGRIVAWGLVPTLSPEEIDRETVDSLVAAWEERADAVTALDIDPSTLRRQSLITPACGTGSLSLAHAERVLSLTRGVADRIRAI